jgi:hypothetical protein
MSLKHVDLESALRRLADKRIEDAIKEGKFDNLPGKGKPLDLEPMPAEENARMTWWMLRILRTNNFTPEEVHWRKALDYLRARLDSLTDESRLPSVVEQINALVRKINTLGTNALQAPVVPVDLETERHRLRDRTTSPAAANGKP